MFSSSSFIFLSTSISVASTIYIAIKPHSLSSLNSHHPRILPPHRAPSPALTLLSLLNKRIKTITTVKRYDDRFYESKGKNDDSLSIPRNTAAIAVDQECINSVLRYMDGDGGEPPRHMEWAFVELVSLYEEEMPKLVCLSVVFPHVYSIVEAFGWDMFKQDGIYDG